MTETHDPFAGTESDPSRVDEFTGYTTEEIRDEAIAGPGDFQRVAEAAIEADGSDERFRKALFINETEPNNHDHVPAPRLTEAQRADFKGFLDELDAEGYSRGTMRPASYAKHWEGAPAGEQSRQEKTARKLATYLDANPRYGAMLVEQVDTIVGHQTEAESVYRDNIKEFEGRSRVREAAAANFHSKDLDDLQTAYGKVRGKGKPEPVVQLNGENKYKSWYNKSRFVPKFIREDTMSTHSKQHDQDHDRDKYAHGHKALPPMADSSKYYSLDSEVTSENGVKARGLVYAREILLEARAKSHLGAMNEDERQAQGQIDLMNDVLSLALDKYTISAQFEANPVNGSLQENVDRLATSVITAEDAFDAGRFTAAVDYDMFMDLNHMTYYVQQLDEAINRTDPITSNGAYTALLGMRNDAVGAYNTYRYHREMVRIAVQEKNGAPRNGNFYGQYGSAEYGGGAITKPYNVIYYDDGSSSNPREEGGARLWPDGSRY